MLTDNLYLVDVFHRKFHFKYGDNIVIVNSTFPSTSSSIYMNICHPKVTENEHLCTISMLYDGSVHIYKERSQDIPIWLNGFRIPSSRSVVLNIGDIVVFGNVLNLFRVNDPEEDEVEREEKGNRLNLPFELKQIIDHGDVSLSIYKSDEKLLLSSTEFDGSIVCCFLFSILLQALELFHFDVLKSKILLSPSDILLIVDIEEPMSSYNYKKQININTKYIVDNMIHVTSTFSNLVSELVNDVHRTPSLDFQNGNSVPQQELSTFIGTYIDKLDILR